MSITLWSLPAHFLDEVEENTGAIAGTYYIAAAIGMPLTGRLADLFGARRIFCVGLLLVGLSGALAPLSPTF